MGYQQSALNCWIAALLYLVTLSLSAHQVWANTQNQDQFKVCPAQIVLLLYSSLDPIGTLYFKKFGSLIILHNIISSLHYKFTNSFACNELIHLDSRNIHVF